MIPMRRFTKYDWYGWAGAQRFKNGAEPLVGEMFINVCQYEACVLISAEDICEITIYDGASKKLDDTILQAPAAAFFALRDGMPYSELAVLGFKKVN